MDLQSGAELPDNSTIIFLVSGGKAHPKGGPCERIDAGGLKCDEDGISVTCIELFKGKGAEQFRTAALAAGSTLKVRKTGVIARITVGKLREFLEKEGGRISVIVDKQPHNDGHCLMKGVSDDDPGFQALVASAFSDFIPVADIPDLVND